MKGWDSKEMMKLVAYLGIFGYHGNKNKLRACQYSQGVIGLCVITL